MQKTYQLRRCRAAEAPLSSDEFNQKSLEIIRRARGPSGTYRVGVSPHPYAARVFAVNVSTETADAMEEECSLC